MDNELITENLDSRGGSANGLLVISNAGATAEKRFYEFFGARLRNKNTRQAYYRAAVRFMNWCGKRKLELTQIEPLHVAGYIENLQKELAAPSVKQHLAAIRMLFDYLVVGQVMAFNPAAPVRGPAHSVKRGKTPVLTADEAKSLLSSIETSTIIGLRDRALIATLLYSFARISAVCGMRVSDYYQQGKRSWLRLHEKGGKFHEVPCHHKAEEYLDAYTTAAGLTAFAKSPLFRSVDGLTGELTDNGLKRTDAYAMVVRRGLAAGISAAVCCHSFRATGITIFLENKGTLETAARIAAHESPRTTKLYDRTADSLTLEEIERIRL